eukprot:5873004-Pyramimonas_sp.AAC.1
MASLASPRSAGTATLDTLARNPQLKRRRAAEPNWPERSAKATSCVTNFALRSLWILTVPPTTR